MAATRALPSLQAPTIVAALRTTAREHERQPALVQRSWDTWSHLTWGQYGRAVAEVAAGLASRGIEPHDAVGVFSPNRTEWHLADLGTMANGSVTVPVDAGATPAEAAYVLGHAEARACFVADHAHLATLLEARGRLPKLDLIVVFDGISLTDDPLVVGLSELRAAGADRLDRDPTFFAERSAAVAPDDLATLVYTRGTTGPPKGVMISHDNIMWTLRSAGSVLELQPRERVMSFVPLHHLAERMMSVFGAIAVGGETWFARTADPVYLAEDLAACRPTAFVAVPKVWAGLRDAVVDGVHGQHGIKPHAVDRYIDLGLRRVAARDSGVDFPWALETEFDALDAVVGRHIRRQLGLDQAHVLASVASPIDLDLMRWLHAARLPVIDIYGQTEGTGATTINPVHRHRTGTVGPAMPGVFVRIADDGEVLVKGDNVCMGYFKDPDASARLLDGRGWMHSGDLGTFTPDGYLVLTGRKGDAGPARA